MNGQTCRCRNGWFLTVRCRSSRNSEKSFRRSNIPTPASSPSKVRQVLDLIRGQDVERAREILRFCERDAAEVVGKVLNSAVANADHDPASPERASADVRTTPVVVARTDVDTSQEVTFAAFTDPAVYSRWLGVPVTLRDGRFACTMEWGTNVRGRYELVCPPELIVMRWDFEDGNVPVPGGEMTGYLRIQPRDGGSHVEVHQLVDSPAQAIFMEGAWSMVLGRLKAGVTRASDPAQPMPSRPSRPKLRPPGE